MRLHQQRHQREGRHDGQYHRAKQDIEPAQAGCLPDQIHAFPERGPQAGLLAAGHASLWNAAAQQRRDAEQGRGDVNAQRPADRHHADGECAQGCRDNQREALQGLVQPRRANQEAARHQHGHTGRRGRRLECLRGTPDRHHHVGMPQRDPAGQEQRDQQQHAQGADAVGHDHQQPAAVAVRKRAAERAEHGLGQQRRQAGRGQCRYAARGIGDPPEQDKLGQRRADQRQRLPAEDRPESRPPARARVQPRGGGAGDPARIRRLVRRTCIPEQRRFGAVGVLAWRIHRRSSLGQFALLTPRPCGRRLQRPFPPGRRPTPCRARPRC